jgi:nitrite reductase (NADH) large subunit
VTTRRLVVVGNGMVGHRLVEALHERDPQATWHVTVLGEEGRHAYDRVALSSVFDGKSPDDLCLVADGFYDSGRREVFLREQVTSVDRANRRVTTANGRDFAYDALVLATGSYAFVPAVPGHDLPGCFVYRTLDDLEAIRVHCASARRGVVVGGGLLGLEAANALLSLGLETSVVEFAPRLMPAQVDTAGGETLRRHIESLGVTVHLATATTAIVAGSHGQVEAMTVRSSVDEAERTLPTDIVVFAAGVRPRDELARSCDLPVGERGGVLVDRSCRTADPAVYAIGECACVNGSVYGLVAPGYAMAEIVADQLTGRSGELVTPDLSTKLKLLGVDVASFGDAHARTDDALEIVFSDPVRGRYQKLVVTDDASTLLGGILVGDAAHYATLRALVGQSLSADPRELLLGDPAAASGAGLGPATLICSCRAVDKGAICSAITECALSDVAGIKARTGAGTVCGSCVPMLKTLLSESGVEADPALCEHFDVSRAQLFDIVRVTGIRTFSELLDRHGRGRGCDICRPAVASILASLGNGHILDGEQAALQDTNDHFLANLQRNGTYSVVPRVPGGEILPDKLIVLGQVARDFGLYTKITGGQRIDLFGARVEQLPEIWRRLVEAGFESGHAYGKALRTVKSCVGSTWCRYGVQDSVGLAVELELRYRGLRAPHKIKAGVSGCARECAEAQSKDFGIIATEDGWNLFVGGNGGFRPRHADLLLSNVDTESLIRTIDRFLMFYIRTADRLQRTAAWIESMEGGIEYLRSVLVDDALGIAEELDEAMARHIESYEDEWRAVLADPQRLARFVSFVNAPDAPDPTISFVSERGQPRPAGQKIPARLVAGPVLEVVRS